MWRIIFPLIIAVIGIVGNVILNTTWGEAYFQNSTFLDILKTITYMTAVIPALYSLIRAEARYKESETRYENLEKEKRKEVALDILRDLLRAAVVKLFINEELNAIRANVMVVDNAQLMILCSINMEFCTDYNIRLDYGQGCAGMAWKRACEASTSERWVPVLAPKANLTPKKLRDMWHFTDKLVEETKKVYWVLSTPIFGHINSGTKFFGILNIDGYGKPLRGPRKLKNPTLHKDCADIAEYFGKVLIENGIIS